MKTVCKKESCVGCMACMDSCAKNAISVIDEISAYNAYIDEDKCVNCHVCEKVCQNNNMNVKLRRPIYWNQGWAQDALIRKECASGGIATALIRNFLNNMGWVCSCKIINNQVTFYLTNNPEDFFSFKGSIYVKSNPRGIYQKIYQLLVDSEKVLFIGLPCQVAALKNYVGDKYESNLFTVDLICHGTPSPKFIHMYMKEQKIAVDQIQNMKFRGKDTFSLSLDGEKVAKNEFLDIYMEAFTEGLFYTENCYECKFATVDRVSDICIGDSWETELSDEVKKGVSLMLCQSEKGMDLLRDADIELRDVDLEKAISANHQLQMASKKPPERDKFMKLIMNGKTLDSAYARCYLEKYCKRKIKSWLRIITQ